MRDVQGLEALSNQHGIQVISHLREELRKSASLWNIRHLITYRLLVRPPAELLPPLKSDHDRRCPLCNHHDESCPQQLDRVRIRSLLGETPRDLCVKLESELMKLPDGFFLVALARAARPNPADPAKEYSQRERKPVERQDYISSTDEIGGSSSPIPLSSSSYGDNMGSVVDEDGHEEQRRKPEEVTVHLVTSFLQHALSVVSCNTLTLRQPRWRCGLGWNA